jgi:hypothetical protein
MFMKHPVPEGGAMKLVKILATALWALGVALASAAYADPPSIIGRINS